MDEKLRKFSNNSCETRSPILLRRRLSAPETIMRKHVLAMQQSELMEGGNDTQSDSRYRHDTDIGCSDTNLNKQIRKSTLLKRFWSNNNNRQYSYSRFPNSFYEWQYEKLTSGRSTNSLTSIHSSPEHLIKTQSRRSLQNSPQHRKISPKHDFNKNLTIPKRKISVYENCYDYNKNYDNTKSTVTDSVCTSNKSNFSNSNSTPLEIRKEIIEESDITINDSNYNLPSSQYIKYSSSLNDSSSVRSVETTNVNVITNVQLSQATLDLIFNQVMKDVQNSAILNDNQPTSFYLKQNLDNSENSQIVKCMISNVSTGSSYVKTDIPIVPRLSALPRTTSMEVNMSSNTPTDKESDTSSLADSLEETIVKTTEVINIKSDNRLKETMNKPTAFFIPIEIENKTDYKAVSEHLPDKLKDRLIKRQQKREEKLQNRKFNCDNCLNNNHEEFNYTKLKKHKPLLPSIKSFRKIKIDESQNYDKKSKVIKKKTDVYNKSSLRGKNEKLSPLCTTKSELLCNEAGTKKFYHKTEFNNLNKRIEILEIMECIDTPNKRNFNKNKSKIPVLINRLPKIDNNNSKIKPTYLDINCDNIDDPKLDQLIANILIDTLNNDEQVKFDKKSTKHSSPKYQQKFESIPEELTLQQSSNNNYNNNNNDNNNNNSNDNDRKFLDEASGVYKGKAAVAVIKDDNIASIPKGWITFYMLHKNRGSPDSTSDEGKDNANANVKKIQLNNNDNVINKSSNISDSIENQPLNCDNPEKFGRHLDDKSIRYKYNDNKHQQLGEWSVTINGTNNYGQFAPNLEMRFKFPDINQNLLINNQTEIRSGNDHIHLPKIDIKNKIRKFETDDAMCRPSHLPEIRPDKLRPKIDGVPSKFEPRQTRTSLRRYNLSRPKFDYHHITNTS